MTRAEKVKEYFKYNPEEIKYTEWDENGNWLYSVNKHGDGFESSFDVNDKRVYDYWFILKDNYFRFMNIINK